MDFRKLFGGSSEVHEDGEACQVIARTNCEVSSGVHDVAAFHIPSTGLSVPEDASWIVNAVLSEMSKFEHDGIAFGQLKSLVRIVHCGADNVRINYRCHIQSILSAGRKVSRHGDGTLIRMQ